VQSGAERLLRRALTADPGFALGHAVLALLGREWGIEVDVDAALAAAHRFQAGSDEREQRFIDVATARVRDPGASSAASLLHYINAYPEDALAVSIAVPTIAFGGATELPAEAWSLIDALAPTYRNDWWYLGLRAFFLQEQERWQEAMFLAERSLALEPAAGHAVHARAHVHYETGDHRAGLTWLDRWIAGCGARSSHRAHFSWHAALHELSLGDREAVLRRYRAQLAPPRVGGMRALVDSAALLWRARMIGMSDLADAAAALSVAPRAVLAEPPTPFAGLHVAVALAAAGSGDRLVGLRRYAERQRNPAFPEVIAPLCEALGALLAADHAAAYRILGELRGVDRVGGSAAQREIIEETALFCAVAAGDSDAARQVLTARLDRRDSVLDRRRLGALDAVRPAVS
jgi:tetratricopeptide (TPR) repeat protein